MSRANGGTHPLRPLLPIPVKIVVGAIGIGIGCMLVPLLGLKWLKNHIFFSRKEIEKLHNESMASIEMERQDDIREFVFCLEQEIAEGNQAREAILNLRSEIICLMHVEASYINEVRELQDSVAHERHLKNEVEKQLRDLEKEMQKGKESSDELISNLQAAQSMYSNQFEELKDRYILEQNLNADMKNKIGNLKMKLEDTSEVQKKESQLLLELQDQNEIFKYGQTFAERKYEELEVKNSQEKMKIVEMQIELDKLKMKVEEAQEAKQKQAELVCQLRQKNYLLEAEMATEIEDLKVKVKEEEEARKKESELVCLLETQKISLQDSETVLIKQVKQLNESSLQSQMQMDNLRREAAELKGRMLKEAEDKDFKLQEKINDFNLKLEEMQKNENKASLLLRTLQKKHKSLQVGRFP